MSQLSPRTAHILQTIVKTHIETGEPVASQDVARLRRHHLSSASIRNVMAELSEQGFLSQPHTSAGRVPTGKAYEAYVHSLGHGRLATAEVGRIRDALGGTQTVEERVEVTSQVLTDMTNGVGIAAAIPTASQTLHQLELVPLDGRRILMVVVTQDRLVRNHVVLLDEPVSHAELASIRNFLNENYSGWRLTEIQQELRRRLEQATTAYHEMLRKLVSLYDKCLAGSGLEPEVHLDGTFNLVSFDFRLTRERMREMFRTLEEKKRILQLLERFLEPPSGEVVFQIGLEAEEPSLGALSLIGVALQSPGGLTSHFAVIGPMRMDYERAVSAVRHVSHAFQSVSGQV